MPPEQLDEVCAICGEDGREGGRLLLLERGRIETSGLKRGGGGGVSVSLSWLLLQSVWVLQQRQRGGVREDEVALITEGRRRRPSLCCGHPGPMSEV